MLKLTVTLALALYAGFVIWGQPTDATTEREALAPVIASVVPTERSEFTEPTILGAEPEAQVTRTIVEAPDPAAIAASTPVPSVSEPRLIGEPVVVSLVSPASRPSEEAAPEAPTNLLRVTGSRVNMRSGPSTSNGVVDSLPQGTLAEPLGEPIDGWQEIRDVETGRTGFMADRFLEPS
ncbi:SH3 domain-containing protein [Jannaschia seohaensis]|uniref:SH3 domain-containing protein n=1 Tax=Jannaschia seohaensis TaxID=475081 RepID=A0A2Y9ADP2_9RHOB|nr:SH3 domain-containing protein [Jannaschia seohaensis]PWJ20958.1 SH3 domain-containing protein [Jannaschia seohaensis]SSA41368.1 SH3 domain-containing protein [Jannaschia seohaensis]